MSSISNDFDIVDVSFIPMLVISILLFIYIIIISYKLYISIDTEILDIKETSMENNPEVTNQPIASIQLTSAQAALSKYKEKIEIDWREIELYEELQENIITTTYKAKWRGSTVNVIQLKIEISKSILDTEIIQLIKARHPSLVIFMGYSFNIQTKKYCIVTQHMARGSLYTILHDKTLSLNWRQRLAMLLDIAKGLLFLHNSDIVHMDFKSTAILIDEEWQAKISNYGLQTICQQSQTAANADTPLWSAPEVILYGKTSKAADVYSFAIIIWEMLTRKIPFGNLTENPIKLIKNIVNSNLRPPIPPTCPVILAKVLQQCWSENPDSRPSLLLVIDTLIQAASENIDLNEAAFLKIERASEISIKPSWHIPYEEIVFEKKIGHGSFGQVFLGTFRGQKVAVKRLAGIVSIGQMNDFISELSIMSEMRHPNIVLFIGACLTPPNICIVMEYCERGNLYDLLHDKSFHVDYNMIVKVLQETALAINYLHGFKNPILHLDLKSINILLDSNGNIKVSDFGLTKVKNKTTGDYNLRLGTPLWLAPESMEDRIFTEASDVYSFGVVIWEMFVRKDPFYEYLPIKAAMLVLTENLRPQIPSFVPPEISQLIADCWKRDPLLRPTFKSILKRLEKIKADGIPRLELSRVNAQLYRKSILVDAFQSKDSIIVYKAWGSGESKPGDWVIVGPSNDVYTCDRAIFESTYRRDKDRVYRKIGTIWGKKMADSFLVATLEGMEHGEPGDYLAQNSADGEQWPIDAKTFENTYELEPSQKSFINVDEEFKNKIIMDSSRRNSHMPDSPARSQFSNSNNLY